MVESRYPFPLLLSGCEGVFVLSSVPGEKSLNQCPFVVDVAGSEMRDEWAVAIPESNDILGMIERLLSLSQSLRRSCARTRFTFKGRDRMDGLIIRSSCAFDTAHAFSPAY